MSACDDSAKNYVAAIKKRPSHGVIPLPIFPILPKINYMPTNSRNPFEKQESNLENFLRKKESLENYAISNLHMVGTISNCKQVWAIIAAPDGSTHLATAGNYIGLHGGQIIKVQPYQVELVETLQENGDWKKQLFTIQFENK